MVLAQVVPARLGEQGLYLLAAVSGIGDVDAISLSMAQLGGGVATLQGAAIAVAVAGFTNTVVKAGLAFAVGRSGMAWRLAAVLLASAVVGAVAFAWGQPA
jgi:uncharacterized membrane protein (DUF4010 family)